MLVVPLLQVFVSDHSVLGKIQCEHALFWDRKFNTLCVTRKEFHSLCSLEMWTEVPSTVNRWTSKHYFVLCFQHCLKIGIGVFYQHMFFPLPKFVVSSSEHTRKKMLLWHQVNRNSTVWKLLLFYFTELKKWWFPQCQWNMKLMQR